MWLNDLFTLYLCYCCTKVSSSVLFLKFITLSLQHHEMPVPSASLKQWLFCNRAANEISQTKEYTLKHGKHKKDISPQDITHSSIIYWRNSHRLRGWFRHRQNHQACASCRHISRRRVSHDTPGSDILHLIFHHTHRHPRSRPHACCHGARLEVSVVYDYGRCPEPSRRPFPSVALQHGRSRRPVSYAAARKRRHTLRHSPI